MTKVAIVRGKFLNQYEMQSFVPLVKHYDLTVFGSLYPFHDSFPFPVVKLFSPMDLPDIKYKMPILNRLFIDAHYLFGLEKQLKGFDIVHSAETYYYYTRQCLNAKKKGYVKKVIATVLENIPFNNEGIWGRRAFKLRARNELDHIIALTNKTKEALIVEGADPNKITVIGHGIDTTRFMPAKNHWQKLIDNKHVLTILFTGRLEWYKGIFETLEAFRVIRQKTMSMGQRMRLVFVGEGSGRKRLERKIKEYGLENFVLIKNSTYELMPEIYRQADIFIAPSKPCTVMVRGKSTLTWQEQYCTALLEAQSMGLPIITTRCGGIPENTGDCALYAKEDDTRELAQHLQNFIAHPQLRLTFGKKARKRAETVHDATIVANKIAAVYEKVLS